MKILHINSTLVKNSGVMSVVMNYYRNIPREQIHFDFAYYCDTKVTFKNYIEEIKQLGGNCYRLPDLKNVIEFNKQLGILLKRNNYNIVHIHDAFIIKLIYHTLRKCGVTNIIIHSHATRWSDKRISGMRNALLCYNLLKYVDYPFACSRAAGKFMFGTQSDFYVMNNAIELNDFAFDEDERKGIREELCLTGKRVYGHVGNFCEQKNHHFLIEVFKEIVTIDNNAFLLLVGDGVLMNEVKQHVKNAHLNERVIFYGKTTEVKRVYSCMDCLILPSLYEGLPMVGVEAQCNGLPILLSNTITKEVGGVNSKYLSLNDDYQIWAKCAVKLAKTAINRAAAGKMMSDMGFDIKK